MTRVLVLGATGHAGSAALAHLAGRADTIAAVRAGHESDRLSAQVRTAVIDLDDPSTLRDATRGVDVVVNAIRLREDIPDTALIDLHHRILDAAPGPDSPTVVTVGGAGSLRLPGGTRFWQDSAFPVPTLPRGRAHARLRDHLEAGHAGDRWAYLIPPPAFTPDAPARGTYRSFEPGDDESGFTRCSISYLDYALALASTAVERRIGTALIAGDQ